MNIKYILILLLIFTMNTYAENELSKKEMKHIAKSEYSLHLENNKEEIKAAHRVIKKLKKELRRDKEFRGLIKASRKNPQLKSDVTAHVKII
jgi:hypothetical protein